MAGHNKWAQIKHKKGSEDAKRSKLFASLTRNLIIEARRAGGDRNVPGLRQAILRAKAANMPGQNIDRALERASGSGGAELTEVVYEAYGPGGSALIIKTITDNTNRTVNGLKHLLEENGGTLAAPGGALWAFHKTPEGAFLPKTPFFLDAAAREALRNLAAKLSDHDDVQEIWSNADYRS